MLAIVREGFWGQGYLQNAHKVLSILGQLDKQQIAASTEKLEVLKRKATSSYYQFQVTSSQSELSALSNRLLGMERFADSLCAFLTYRAENAGSIPEPPTWRPGAAAPLFTGQQSAPYTGPKFQIPAEYLCPISSEIMEDPVMTVDNFTYERKNIERWYVFHSLQNSLVIFPYSDMVRRISIPLTRNLRNCSSARGTVVFLLRSPLNHSFSF